MSDPKPPAKQPIEKHQVRQLAIPKLPQLSWSAANAEQSLQWVYEHVRDDALATAGWYRRARVAKRLMAYWVRFTAIFLAGAAAIFPLLNEVLLDQDLRVSGVWTSIALTLAGGAVAFDRLLGYSSGWVRYMKTELQIRHALELFELDWESRRATWQDRPPAPAQVRDMLAHARGFTDQINTLVGEETNAWMEEFQRSLKQLDDLVQLRADEAKAMTDATQPGILSLTVPNGDDAEDGWKVTIDEQGERTGRGKTAVLTGLAPGFHVVRITGRIGNKERYAEIPITVPAGGMVAMEARLT